MKKLLTLLATVALVTGLAVTAMADTVADEQAPSDVESLQAVAGDSAVTVSWDVATDDTGVTGYKVFYGTSSVYDVDDYTFTIDVGDVIEYDVTSLENGTTYYFSVVAYDAAANHSENYALEAEAMPEAGLGGGETDVEAPTVVDAEAVSKIEVKVEFSEPIAFYADLLDSPEQAFTIIDDDTYEPLDILDAEIMEDDDVEDGEEGLMVLLTTDVQTLDANYVLTVTQDVEDLAGNNIISGTSDTAGFLGSDLDPTAGDTDGPEIVKVETADATTMVLTFDETVVLGLDPVQNFAVYPKDDVLGGLEVSQVILGNDTDSGSIDASVVLTVAEMTAGTTYVVEVTGITDEEGNEITANTIEVVALEGAGGVEGEGEGEGEVVADELVDAENFVGKFIKQEETLSVLLNWTLPEGEVAKAQKVYRSTDGAAYDKEGDLGSGAASYSVTDDLSEGDVLWFKLTQLDEEGNESEGVLAKVTLTETGPGVVGLVLVSLGLGRFASRKRK
ncbi:fibronectin type III domain-containing protein [Candidatus Peregrinibacteria bacterium]|jgi:hypothetical protein|nr:fibronectin type III domain-containing protein [Candidatus Peregrinibacteria bacterium]